VAFSAQEQNPRFSQPFRYILTMIIILGIVAGICYLLAPTVWPVFEASPYLNGFIIVVFIFGVAACFWQVLTLISSVSWIEGFAMDRPGHEFVAAPRLLAPLASLLSDTRARRALTTSSTRSILDTVAQRLDEARDITRYIVNLLIFLGLLGTFYGLATTVPAVVDTIRSMAPRTVFTQNSRSGCRQSLASVSAQGTEIGKLRITQLLLGLSIVLPSRLRPSRTLFCARKRTGPRWIEKWVLWRMPSVVSRVSCPMG